MGKIEEVIFENYQEALKLGDLNQARRAAELARIFKAHLEYENFIDYQFAFSDPTSSFNSLTNPTPYQYSPLNGIVTLNNHSVSLTKSENFLFLFFSQHESSLKDTHIITASEISKYLYLEQLTSSSSTRLAIHRLRNKIEFNPSHPKIILSVYQKGYIFWAKRIF